VISHDDGGNDEPIVIDCNDDYYQQEQMKEI
jgi:hypothetical protein